MYYRLDILVLSKKKCNPFYEGSPAPRMTYFSDHLLLVASHALGWSGIAAAWSAPRRVNRYYIGFNLFLIVIGMLYQWQVIRSLNNQYLLGLLRVRALFRELRKVKKHAAPP